MSDVADESFERCISDLAALALECEPEADARRRATLESVRRGGWTERLVAQLAHETGENVNVALARYRLEGRP